MDKTEQRTKSALEKSLSVFTEIKAGEGYIAILMTLNIFLILTAYLVAKVVREPLILAGGGAEVKSYAAAIQAVVLVGFIRIYATLVEKVARRQLNIMITLFFGACLVVFYGLTTVNAPIGVVYYIWVGIFSLMVIAQFWAFANDIYTPEEGKRLFVILQVGASAGGVFGPFIARGLLEIVGINVLLLLSAAILVFGLVINNHVDSRCREKAAIMTTAKGKEKEEESIGKADAFKVVFRNKYLLMIAFIILFTNWVNTTGEYMLGKAVETASHVAAEESAMAPNETGEFIRSYIGKFYSEFFFVVGLAGVLVQLFLVSRILKYCGIRVAIMMLPTFALGGYALIGLFPVLKDMRFPKMVENSTDYSLNSTVRQILFLPTTREEKYKAKMAIDSFFVRAGDVLAALLVFVGVTYFDFGIRQFAMVNLCLVAVWLWLAFVTGKENARLVAEREGREG